MRARRQTATMRRLSPQRDNPWILASASPRRRDLLTAAGQRFEIVASDVDERPRRDESADALATRLAREKADDVWRRHPERWVLAADTIVAIDHRVLGKPVDDTDARAMLRLLSGRAHHVVTGFVLLAPEGRASVEECVTTHVVFHPLSERQIEDYVASGEPRDKAGAYAIQGGAGQFVAEIHGSYSNVVGLPMESVEEALRSTGLWSG